MKFENKDLEKVYDWLAKHEDVRIEYDNDWSISFTYTVNYDGSGKTGILCAFDVCDEDGSLRLVHRADEDLDFSGLFNFHNKSAAYEKVDKFLADFRKDNNLKN